MRKNMQSANDKGYRIIAVDDEEGIVDSLSIFLKRSGYSFTGITNPLEAINLVKNEHFDLMILDFIMTPFHGDQVVEEIRKFNKDLYIRSSRLLVKSANFSSIFFQKEAHFIQKSRKMATSLARNSHNLCTNLL